MRWIFSEVSAFHKLNRIFWDWYLLTDRLGYESQEPGCFIWQKSGNSAGFRVFFRRCGASRYSGFFSAYPLYQKCGKKKTGIAMVGKKEHADAHFSIRSAGCFQGAFSSYG